MPNKLQIPDDAAAPQTSAPALAGDVVAGAPVPEITTATAVPAPDQATTLAAPEPAVSVATVPEATPSEGVASPPPAAVAPEAPIVSPPAPIVSPAAVIVPPAPDLLREAPADGIEKTEVPGPVLTVPGPTAEELTLEELEELTRPESAGQMIISADEVRGFIAACAAGKAQVLPAAVAELAEAIATGRAPDVTPELFQQLKLLLPADPVPEERPNPALVRVRFVNAMNPYAGGDLAGFELERCQQLVDAGFAVFDPPLK